jgi:hypothetical protein
LRCTSPVNLARTRLKNRILLEIYYLPGDLEAQGLRR